jgi:glucose-6-phosphate 1-dehydrogenase
MAQAVDRSEISQRDGYYCPMAQDPCAIVIFGASGDLTRRKLLPALYDLAAHNRVAPRFAVVGFARSPVGDEGFREQAERAVRSHPEVGPVREEIWREFSQGLVYFQGEYGDPEAYARLAARLAELDRERTLGGNRVFYLATPPEIYPVVIGQLGAAGLARPATSASWVRIIIEKPFGHDLESAARLNRTVLGVFDESQVYRIDHYLGKETVQNLLVFRFGNGVFEPLWNRRYIDHVQITAAESLGVERRASFYEATGALRDMIQSHVLQLTSLVALEPPATFDATAVRNEKIKVLQSIRPFVPEAVGDAVVRAQYAAGSMAGQAVPGYGEEPGVRAGSTTETYVALKLWIDNWRWAGVPFYLRTGKCLKRRVTEVAIQFHEAPHAVFRGRQIHPNLLVLNIQPEEGISLSFGAKPPGQELAIRTVEMSFLYRTTFGPGSRSAYATLVNDCLRGDATLFDRADSVEAAWKLLDPILQAWQGPAAPPLDRYPAGSDGPPSAEKLLAEEGFRWRSLDEASLPAPAGLPTVAGAGTPK